MHITSLPGVRAALRLSANQLADGYAVRQQSQGQVVKQAYTLPGLENTQVLTLYGVAKRTADTDLSFLFSIPDYATNSAEQDVCFTGNFSSYGIKGLAFNTYTAAFTGQPYPLPEMAVGKYFQYSIRLYNNHPELIELRLNGQQLSVTTTNAHANRFFSQMYIIGGTGSGPSLDWVGEIPETILYLSNQSAAVDAQNEAYLMQLYNIAP